MRVDNFVYTAESVKSALARLDQDGLLSLTFATGGDHPVTRRLYQTVWLAAGKAPLAYVDDQWQSVILLSGPAADHAAPTQAELGPLQPWPRTNESADSRPATDDWPFLYLEWNAYGMFVYFGILLVGVVGPALILGRASEGGISGSAWGNMFFLGQAFMLMETKSITQLSLFYGATWLVSSAVTFCVLILAFAANLCASKMKNANLGYLYCGLALALLLDFVFKVPPSTEVNQLFLVGAATLIACLPIFFGGLIFSSCFSQAKTPAQYLSANLLGVAIGGLVENFCLLTGIKGLSLIALLLYGLSYISLKIGKKSS